MENTSLWLRKNPDNWLIICLIAEEEKKANEEQYEEDFNHDEDGDDNEIDIDVLNMNSDDELVTNKKEIPLNLKIPMVFIKELSWKL